MNINDFAYNVSRLRKQSQMSQGDLAEKLNVSISAVSKWENGKNLPGIDTIKEIAAFFDVPIEDLLNPYVAGAIIELEETASTEASNIQIQKKTSKPFVRAIVITTILVCLCTAGFLAAAKLNTPSNQPKIVNTRVVEDATWGATMELAIYCHDNFSGNIAKEYASVIREEWLQKGKHGGETINAIKVNFYTNRKDAKNFSEESDIYFMIFPMQ